MESCTFIIIVILIILVVYFVFVVDESFTQQQKESIASNIVKNKTVLDNSKQKYTDLKKIIPILNAPTYDKIYNLYRNDNLNEENIIDSI